MKFNVIIKCKNLLEVTKEKILEWYDFLMRRNEKTTAPNLFLVLFFGKSKKKSTIQV